MSPISLRLPITDRAGIVRAVDARNLYAWLEPGRDFSTWLREITTDDRWIANADFRVFQQSPKSGEKLGHRPRVECALSIRVAKHVAMLSRTDRGFDAREYFLECEERAKPDPIALLGDPNVLRLLLGNYAERVEAAERRIAADAPKVDAYDRIVDCGDTEGFRAAAKVVHAATGAKEPEVRSFMLRRGWIQRLDGRLMPAHAGTERGYVTTRDREWSDSDGNQHVKAELRVTQRGIARAITVLLASEAA